MANKKQLSVLKKGVDVWNKWRKENPDAEIDLSDARFSGENLSGANLSRANLGHAILFNVNLTGAKLSKAILTKADLRAANLSSANLSGSYLIEANLVGTNLNRANLRRATLNSAQILFSDLSGADLREASLIHTSFISTIISGAKISRSLVYGINIWDLKGEFKEQEELVITSPMEQEITIDNVKVAQFVYLILNNKELRDVINTLTSKTVLILGRFSIPERKAILDALRNKLREYDLLPIVFDFDRPTDKDFTETIKTLAGISYFVIADITNPKSSPLELQATVPDYQIPFVPIIQEGESPFAMMVDLQKKYSWVLPTKRYDSIETLMSALKPGIIDPAVEMRNKLRLIKAQEHPTESLRDYLDKTL